MKMKIDNATSCLVDDAISIWFEVIYHFAYGRIGVNTDDYLLVLFEIIIYISSTCYCWAINFEIRAVNIGNSIRMYKLG
jgi:hypothetical protein